MQDTNTQHEEGTQSGSVIRTSPRVLLKRLREIMATDASIQGKINKIVTAIASNLIADTCSIYVRTENSRLKLYAAEGLNPQAIGNTTLELEEGLVGLVVQKSTILATSDAPSHPNFSHRPELGEELLQSFLGIPLRHESRVFGALCIQNKAARDYTEEEEEALLLLGTVVSVLLVETLDPDLTDIEDGTSQSKNAARHVRYRGIVLQSINLKQQIDMALKQVSSTKPNHPDTIQLDQRKKEILKEISIGLEKITQKVQTLESHDISRHEKEVVSILRDLADRFETFLKLQDSSTIENILSMSVATGFIGLASMAGANMLFATPIIYGIFGGKKVAKIIEKIRGAPSD